MDAYFYRETCLQPLPHDCAYAVLALSVATIGLWVYVPSSRGVIGEVSPYQYMVPSELRAARLAASNSIVNLRHVRGIHCDRLGQKHNNTTSDKWTNGAGSHLFHSIFTFDLSRMLWMFLFMNELTCIEESPVIPPFSPPRPPLPSPLS